MEKKEDRRVTMTRRMLKEALTELLRETDIYHVSIRELCQRADINRTTWRMTCWYSFQIPSGNMRMIR